MKGTLAHKIKKILLWTVLSVPVLVVAIAMLLYVPFIQNFAKDFAVEKISESTGMTVQLDYLRLKFPLRLELRGLSMVDKADTLLAARDARVNVGFWPLLRGEIAVDEAELNEGYYRLNNADSAVYLKARINRFTTAGTRLRLNMERISVGETVLDGGDVWLTLKDTTTVSEPDTASAMQMLILAPDVAIRRLGFHMTMLPTIDTLNTFIGSARLAGGHLDMAAHTIDADSLVVDSLTATYLTPSARFLAEYDAVKQPETAAETEETLSAPWKIRAGKIRVGVDRALYGQSEAPVGHGFDMGHLQVSGVKIEVDSFFNCGTSIKVPLRELSAMTSFGVPLHAKGVFGMDSTAMHVDDFEVNTDRSHLKATALMGLGDLTKDSSLPLRFVGEGRIGLADVGAAMPAMVPLLRGISLDKSVDFEADVKGRSGQLDIGAVKAGIEGIVKVGASGVVNNPFEFNRMDGRVKIDGEVVQSKPLMALLLTPEMRRTLTVPPMKIKGDIDYKPGKIDGKLTARTAGGKLALDALWNQRAEGYDVELAADRFPIERIMPSLGVADLTLNGSVKGRGYSPFKRSTHATADIDVVSVKYNGHSLSDITLHASLDTCRLTANVVSANPDASLDADLIADFTSEGYVWDLNGDVHSLNLQALGLAENPLGGRLALYSSGRFNPTDRSIDAELDINDLDWQMGQDFMKIAHANAGFMSYDSLTSLRLESEDMKAQVVAYCSLDTLMGKFTSTGAVVKQQMDSARIDVERLQQALPAITATIAAGGNNPVVRYLKSSSGISFRQTDIRFTNDSVINFAGDIRGFENKSLRLDTISLTARQRGKNLFYEASVGNKPGTMDDFAHVSLHGVLSSDKLMAILQQSNIKGRRGFLLGLVTTMRDKTLHLKFEPYTPVIAYKQWSVNPDNFIEFNFPEKHLDANLTLRSDSSSLRLYTEHQDLLAGDSLAVHGQEDVVVQLDNINLEEWLSVSPFAPPVKGDIDANLRFRWTASEITGRGKVDVNNLYYGRERVGTFGLNLDVANESHTGALRANVGLTVDDVEVITATGNLNDSTAVHPFLLDFSMIHFPLRVVNPFLPKGVARLSGMLNGRMDITGDLARPIFNGYLDFDSTAVDVGITGARYRFSEEKIPVDSNIVRFDDFRISGLNKNDLHVNGTVDARRLSDIGINLSLNASDMQIVNSSRPKGASLYGKAFIDLDAKVRGNMELLNVDATLDILAGTNVTYVVQDAQSVIASRSTGDMVKFVLFADTTQMLAADTIVPSSMSMVLNANLIVSQGSTINVDLSTDGKNKVSIQSTGNLTYNLTPLNGDGRLTGRLTINKGFVRYSPPFMSEKNFTFEEGSYVAFTGVMLNPTLNIKAVDRLKANVTQSGQNSRMVNFDVHVAVTNTLENMNVVFDLSTDDDLTIQNELSSMSPDQRANQAMNMLLYNVYTGPGTKGNANLSGNPLFSFLTSQLNTWTANNIRGVDISFGIDQYDTTTDGAKSTTTSYSYRVSKTLFNDRFKIVVGGNYSTDADADENFSQNLINDISFEYMLNRSGSMYLRLFRHVGYESILEGEITQTGVGFVLKRKLNSLRDIFRFAPRKKEPEMKPADETED